tara:strand:+ start:3225 stop:3632 length:408 start_codon:yes stop_codon:yes gene_type:complete
MAVKTGNSGQIKVDTAGGGAVQLVGQVRGFSLETTSDTVDTSTIGQTARTYDKTLTSSSLSVDALWDASDTNGQLLLDSGLAIEFELYPTGSSAGEVKFTGSGVVTSKNVTGTFDGLVEASFSIQVSGLLTEAVI